MKERILRFWGIIRPRETNAFIWLALIVGLALVIRVVWVLVSQTTPVNEASVYDRLAWSLASDKEYVSKDGTPTAFRPVGYPGFLAGVYLVFGRSWIVGGIANALLGTVTVGLTYMLARTVLSIRLSLAAALLIALLPSHIFGYTAVLRMEALHTVFVLCALVLTYWAVCAPRVQNAVLLGLCLGIGVYVRPILLLWASDADWVTFARAINMSIFQDQFQHGIPALKWFTQLYWAAIALMAAGAVLVRPLRYWLSFPANLFPVLVVYWTMFHMAFFGTSRFHSQVIPVIVVLAVHLLSKDRDWLAWVRPFQHRNRSRAENGVDFT